MANASQSHRQLLVRIGSGLLALGAALQLQAATTDLASSPVSTSSSTVVRPNLLFTLDDSGSMSWNYLPDYVGGGMGSGTTHCKVSHTCNTGETPFQENDYNGLAYNPEITYLQPVNADGTLKPSMNSANTTGWTLVKIDGYGVQSTGTTNMVSGYPEVVYCSGSTCKKNGVDTNNPFLLRPSVSADNPPVYAFPGSLTVGSSIALTPYDGILNQPSTSTGTVFNGALDISTSAVNFNLAGVVVARVGVTSTVNVTYNAVTPPLATGDTVVVSGATCGSAFRSGGVSRTITVVNATNFTYTSNAGTSWTGTSCAISATHLAHTAVAPMISKSGNTVTVTLAAAPIPALPVSPSTATVTVANGAGTCDAGYRATNAPMTRISATSFSYPVSTAVGTATNTTCNITQAITSPPSSPGISLSGTTVTVYLTGHGLATGDLVQVSNGTTGICDNGYLTSGSVTVTKDNNNQFHYSPSVGSVTTSSNCRIDKITPASTTSYTTSSTVNANPYYFVIIPTEYCDSIYLTNCVKASAPTGAFTYPAPLRYCKDDATSALPPGDAGAQKSASGTINCQAKFSAVTGLSFQSARYGLFWRNDIVPATATYGNETYSGTVTGTGWTGPLTYNGFSVVDRSQRSDCAAVPSCTYAEEMTNFANWYAYYHTRIQMMKSAAGRAFSVLDNRYRVGFVTINPTSAEYLPVAMFDATQKTNWYAKFYAVNPGNSTPLREALANAGRYFAGKKPGVMTDDPMEYSCQQNFVLITTDGYWNGTDSNVKELDGTTTMRNYDNVDSGTSKRADGAYDGAIAGATDTLADAAMYYYMKDIRDTAWGNCTGTLGGDVCQNNVPMTPKDTAAGLQQTQHMKTFSLGLADGLMTYVPNYDSLTTGDFSSIKTGAIGCTFSGSGTCNWPLPVANTQTALDDLWHAAVNGRGTYYNARDPNSLAAGLSSALADIQVKTYAAAASATSSPVITPAEHTIFSSTYETGVWDGEVVAKLIDATTGVVLPTVIWSAQTQLNAKINSDATPDKVTRLIYTFDGANALGNHIKDFHYANLTAVEKAYFDNKCAFISLTQCSAATLAAGSISAGNVGANLVNYLRGSHDFELPVSAAQPNPAFRTRANVLGDTVNAIPQYVRAAQYDFTDAVTPSYQTYKAAMASRTGVLYMGANDGMLHAFDTSTGNEKWSYIPKIVMPNLYKIADISWGTLHQYYVDGTPEIMDVYVDAATATANFPAPAQAGWHTILVGALGHGGTGFYALDITDPANPVALWEICSDATVCAISDADMGYSYGNPVITKRSTDGKWVVLLTSGYNNVTGTNAGEGILYQLDVITGAVLYKTSTLSGSATAPSGLSKISPWVDSLLTNNTARYVYGGDLNGDIWRFDLGSTGSVAAPTVTRIATLKDAAGVAQPVTSRIELGDPLNNTPNSLAGTGNPGLYIGTGRYLGLTDLSNLQVQTVYAIKDDLSKTGTAAYIGNPRAPNAGFGSLVQQFIYQVANATSRTVSQNAVNWSTGGGWYADLVAYDSTTNLPITPSPSPGERVRLDPNLVSGTLSVISTIPTGSSCSIGGQSWLYSFDFLSGKNLPNKAAGMLLPQGAEGSVVVSVGGAIKEEVTLTSGDVVTPEIPIKGSSATKRVSWRELMQ